MILGESQAPDLASGQRAVFTFCVRENAEWMGDLMVDPGREAWFSFQKGEDLRLYRLRPVI